eukprot:jgi/Antlo1/2257/281
MLSKHKYACFLECNTVESFGVCVCKNEVALREKREEDVALCMAWKGGVREQWSARGH